MADEEMPSGWGSLLGGTLNFWLGVSMYIAKIDLNLGGALGTVFFTGGIFFTGVGVILMVVGLIRIIVRMGFRRTHPAPPAHPESVLEPPTFP